MDTIKLSNGIQMPCVIMSTNWMDYPVMKKVVTVGLKLGYRAFDTARDYGNEDIVGRVISECLKEQNIAREDIFITTKIGNSQQRQGNIEEQIDISLKNLRTDYVDLWIMHWPYPDYFVETYKKMEKVYSNTEKVHAIGMANYKIRHFEHLFSNEIEVVPHCVQYECHPMRIADEILSYCKHRNISVQAYSPLCRMISEIRENNILNSLAKKYDKTIGQIILRWHYQRGTVPVFKSVTPSRLAENIDIFNFELLGDEMELINSLDQDYKFHLESASCPGY